MIVRDYEEADAPAVRALLEAAFPTSVEADLVERLRADGDAAIELVAADGEAIIGHILFSPVEAPFRALALAPVAVPPDRQGQGVGTALIEAGHDRARGAGYDGIFVLGEPDYYRRFGYGTALAEGFRSPYSGLYFMALALRGHLPASGGEVRHSKAFAELG
jgi:putative acetyltransferase